jgi:hypothetical protein
MCAICLVLLKWLFTLARYDVALPAVPDRKQMIRFVFNVPEGRRDVALTEANTSRRRHGR